LETITSVNNILLNKENDNPSISYPKPVAGLTLGGGLDLANGGGIENVENH